MKNLKKSEKILIALLIIFLIGYLYFQYILSPQLNKLKVIEANIESYNNELIQYKMISSSNKKLSENLKEIQSKYKDCLEIIPNVDRSAQIIRDMKNVGDSCNIKLSNLNIGKSLEFGASNMNTDATNNQNTNSAANDSKESSTSDSRAATVKVMAVPIAMNITGEYSNIMNFIKTFEDSKRETEIGTVNISSPTNNNFLTVNFTVNVLYMEDASGVINEYNFNDGNYGKVNPYK
jgi:Tfp pilus assembly protein PilO